MSSQRQRNGLFSLVNLESFSRRYRFRLLLSVSAVAVAAAVASDSTRMAMAARSSAFRSFPRARNIAGSAGTGVGASAGSAAFAATTTTTMPHRRGPTPPPISFPAGKTRRSPVAVGASAATRLFASGASWEPEPEPWESADPLSSPKTPTVKLFKSLLSKRKKRSDLKLTVVEGLRLVLDGLSDPRTRALFRCVIVTRAALDHPDLGVRLREGLDLAASEGGSRVRVSLGTEEVVKAAADTVSPQGVVATVSIPPQYSGPPSHGGKEKGRMYLLLDALSDPGNVGTLLRSSLASGVHAVLLLPGCCDVWNPKSVRSAMGAALKVPVRAVESWEEALDLLEEWGANAEISVWAATMEGSEVAGDSDDRDDENGGGDAFVSRAHYDVDWASPTASALVIGREGEGLSHEVREAVKCGIVRSVHVPMECEVESLNAAVCGSVILFERLRQMRALASGAAVVDSKE